MKKYIITGLCDPYNARFHFNAQNNKALKFDGATPVKWVVDDNYGNGYSLEEAQNILDGYANSMSDDVCYNDDSWIQQLINDAKADDIELDTSWYKGEGWYCGECLIYQHGDESLRDDSMLYWIEDIDEVEGYNTSKLPKNKVLALVCQNYADIVDGNDEYNDYASLEEAIDVVINKLDDEIAKDDLEGWLNPHLDSIYENWEEYE